MKESEKIALTEIRKAAGDAVSDDVWDQIEKQAEDRGGLFALTGAARAVVDGVMMKHGQPGRDKDYARKHPSGGKGGGGGSVQQMDGLPPKDAGKKRRSDPNVERTVEWDKSDPDHSSKVGGPRVMRVTDTYSDGSKKVYRISEKDGTNGTVNMREAIKDGITNGIRMKNPKGAKKLGDPDLDAVWQEAYEAGNRIDQ